MVDNVAITAGSGVTIATDDIGGIQFQRVKLAQGADGTGVDVSPAAPLNVTLANAAFSANKLLVTPDLPTGAATSAKQPALGTAGAAATDVITVQGITSGTSINTVETGAALTALQLIDDSIVASGAALGSTKNTLAGASVTTGAPTYTTGQVNPLSMDTTGSLRTNETGAALTALSLIDDTIVATGTPLGSVKSSLAGASVTTSAPTYTTGQINPLSMDTTGALRVTGGGGGTQYVEDVAAVTDPSGNMLMAVRKDTLSTSEVSADGDNIALKATNKGKLHVAAEVRFGDIPADLGASTGGSATQRVAIDTSQIGSLVVNSVPVITGGNLYVDIAAGTSSAQSCETSSGSAASAAVGAVYLEHLVCVVDDPTTCIVQMTDGASGAFVCLPNDPAAGKGTYHIAFGILNKNIGTFAISTGSGVTVRATGRWP